VNLGSGRPDQGRRLLLPGVLSVPVPYDDLHRDLARWVAESRGMFPEPFAAHSSHYTHAPPVPLGFRNSGPEVDALRKAIAQAVIDVAANFIAAQPAALTDVNVAALLFLPSLESSEVCVFFDLDYFRTFEQRDNKYQRWTPLPKERSLVREHGLRLPAGMRERGYHDWQYDPDDQPPRVFEQEVWLIGD
jgi:hypothetical protein